VQEGCIRNEDKSEGEEGKPTRREMQVCEEHEKERKRK
jgi:hypothetical protein